MFFANNLTTKDWLFIISVIFGLALVLVAILGFINSKSKKGQKLQSKVDAYLSMGELAFTEASKQVGLTGKERKNVAIDYAENEKKKLGYKNVSIQLLSAAIEKAYAKLKLTYDSAYNWGLSSNTDGSEKLADIDLNGIPDSQETSTSTSTSTTVKPTITTTLPPQPQQVSTDSSVVITQATQEPQQLK